MFEQAAETTHSPRGSSPTETRPAVQLAATQQRLERVLATAGMAYWEWEPAGDRLSASPSAKDLYGLPDGQVLASRAQAVAAVHPDDRPSHQAVVDEALRERRGWFTEYRVVRAVDGATSWLEERASTTQDPMGRLQVTALVTDVTDRKRIEEALGATRRRVDPERQEGRERERRAREAAEAFLAVMSHELRTPVTSIRGTAALLARDPQRPDMVDLLADVQEESDRLVRMIDDLLVLSGVDRGLLQLSPEPVLLQHMLPGMADDVRRRFPDVQFVVRVPATLTAVMADTTALRQIVYNLLTNGAKYAGSAGPVTLEAREHGAAVEIAVHDNGPGLGADPESLFALFYRDPDTAAHTSGTGIGLYVVRELICAMGSKIVAQTCQPHGAEFRFTLPAVTDDEA
ncbi:MAG TPA: PAS domain-containing sensor histidine kinase [Candidatus Limnocylindrales bacterium]|jgi:PAS domain S-box-containing protein|nr:PAS domain-containing sensor histidine kinase [Candidatus Limnocylindrales bacterium]